MRSDLTSADLDAVNTTTGASSQFDYFSTAFFIPAGKLDADQYLVNDLDGVGESLFGSGNMNFLMMQAEQTNQALQSIEVFDPAISSSGVAAAAGALGQSSGAIQTQNGFDTAFEASGLSADTLQGDHSSGGPVASGPSALSHNGNDITSATQAPDATSFLSSLPPSSPGTTAQASVNGINGHNGSDGNSGDQGASGNDGQNGTPGVPGNDGNNGGDGHDGGNGGDVTTIINEIVNIVEETVLNPVTKIVTTVTETVFNIVDNLVCNIIDLTNLPSIGLDLLVDLADLTNINLDIFSDNIVFNVIDQALDLSPVTAITDLLADITSTLHLNLLISPLQYDDSADDKDVHVVVDLGLPLIPPVILDIPLDPLEALLGDIDLSLDTSSLLADSLLGNILGGGHDNGDTDLSLAGLDTGGLLNPVEDLIGDLDLSILPDGLGLFGGGETDNNAGDSDIEAPLSVLLADLPLIGQELSVTLDPLENIIGDIDLGLAGSLNLLGDIAAPLVNDIAGGSGQDTVFSGLGDALNTVAATILPSGGDSDADVQSDTALSFAGHDLIDHALDLHLDPLEALVGDIDIGVAPSIDLFGDYEDCSTDTDVTASLDISILGHTLIDQAIHIPLDPVEQILGDIDLDVGITLDLIENPLDVAQTVLETIENTLTGAATLLADAPVVGGLLNLDALPGLGDIGAMPWAENLLPDTGGLFGGGLGGNIADLLPDPIDGGLLTPVLTPPVFSGLFGGGDEGARNFGGLFG